MGKHLKRLAAPRAWKIPRKEKKFAVKPSPGPHAARKSLPLVVVVRDYLKHALTAREAKKIINEGKVLVDGSARKDYKFPVGLMDAVEIPVTKERYIVLLDTNGKLVLKNLPEGAAGVKLCKIVNKTIVRGGKIQLNLHDGRNLLLKDKGETYKTKDTLLLDLSKKEIKQHLAFKEGALAYITGGEHIGEVAKIEAMRSFKSPEPDVVTLSRGEEKFQTIEDYIFVIGEKEPALEGVF